MFAVIILKGTYYAKFLFLYILVLSFGSLLFLERVIAPNRIWEMLGNNGKEHVLYSE